MRAAVEFEGRTVGQIEWTPDAYGVRVSMESDIPCDPLTLLRCYGRTGGQPLLIGLPEPQGGRLRLTRHLSRETLKAAGCAEQPPHAFYLSGSGPGEEQTAAPPLHAEKDALPRTGDEVLDSLIGQQEIRWKEQENAVELRCVFAPDKPFPLAPAFVLCTVQNGEAVLHWTKKDAAGQAASE